LTPDLRSDLTNIACIRKVDAPVAAEIPVDKRPRVNREKVKAAEKDKAEKDKPTEPLAEAPSAEAPSAEAKGASSTTPGGSTTAPPAEAPSAEAKGASEAPAACQPGAAAGLAPVMPSPFVAAETAEAALAIPPPAVLFADVVPGDVGFAVAALLNDDKQCCVCLQVVENTDFVKVGKETLRCGKCNRLQSRVHRALQANSGLQDAWRAMSPQDRRQFFLAHHDAMGPDLAMLIETKVKLGFSETVSSGFNCTGDFMDKQDLETLLKDKPDQLDNVLRTARTIDHPNRKVKLYEFLTFKSSSGQEASSSRGREVAMSNEETVRAKAKPSIAKPKQLKAEREQKVPELTEKAVARLEKIRSKMAEGIEDGAKLSEEIKCVDDVPKKIKQHFDLRVAEARSSFAELQVSIDNKKGKVSDIAGAASGALKALTEAATLVREQLKVLSGL